MLVSISGGHAWSLSSSHKHCRCLEITPAPQLREQCDHDDHGHKSSTKTTNDRNQLGVVLCYSTDCKVHSGKYSLPRQGPVRQSCVSLSGPVQCVPLFRGGGLIQARVRICLPFPQVTGQADHRDHGVHPPLTNNNEQHVITRSSNQKWWIFIRVLQWTCMEMHFIYKKTKWIITLSKTQPIQAPLLPTLFSI